MTARDYIFIAAEWHAEEREPGHWWVIETRPGSMSETHYGPMWPEMVTPLISERREMVAVQVSSIHRSMRESLT